MIPKIVKTVSPNFRAKRDELFRRLYGDLIAHGCTILDIGGEPYYWEKSLGSHAEFYRSCKITLLNPKQQQANLPNIICVAGDATDMREFADQSFDLVLSNAVIEHVGDFEQQRKMANNVQRVGRYYFLHSANYYFPIEPHSFFPFFNQLPLFMQYGIARVWPGQTHIPDFSPKSLEYIRTKVRLLKWREVKELFPRAKIEKEKLWGLNKSFIVHNAP
ncbi:class I SAM-dependent methyltransferase [candidate division KSB1 bacterium]|nr:MAG: class I SAM-dependent methyltransferase [candidate division KSB1 bacterium]